MSSSSISAKPDVAVATTTARVTPTPPRTAFKQVLSQTVVGTAEQAMNMLPGSPLMAVAIRGAAGGAGGALGVPVTSPASMQTRSLNAEGPTTSTAGTSGVIGGVVSGGAATGAAGAVPGTTGDGSIEGSLAQSRDQNLYFLQIQQEMQQQNQQFSTLSNVMKAEHDTVKTAIGNIR